MKDLYGRKLRFRDYLVYGVLGKPETKAQKIVFGAIVALQVVSAVKQIQLMKKI